MINDVLKVSISNGNSKMGLIPSVSLPPVITCPEGVPCAKKCYAAKLCRIYPSVKKAYDNNLYVLRSDWMEYWRQVRAAAKLTKYFRYHVSGDIPNSNYFREMVITACMIPDTKFLAFTKNYEIVNNYINTVGGLPDNLIVIFSRWSSDWNISINNPHDLPMAAVIFKNSSNIEYTNICGGNCTDCANAGGGCWNLKKGDTIAFYER